MASKIKRFEVSMIDNRPSTTTRDIFPVEVYASTRRIALKRAESVHGFSGTYVAIAAKPGAAESAIARKAR